MALEDLGQVKEAIVAYQRSLELDPALDDAHINLGHAFLYEGKVEEAAASYQKAVDINPNFAEGHYGLGAAFRLQGKIEEAATSYRQATTIDPDYAQAHHNLAVVLGEQDKLEEAATSARRAIALKPDFVEAYSNLGIVLGKQGRTQDAAATYRRVLEINPANVSAEFLLATLTGQNPETAPQQYVTNLFDHYSPHFEHHLVKKLEYQTPTLLRRILIQQAPGGTRFRNVLDLGCGTGLGGMEFREIADRLCGIDISSKMIEKAQEKRLYDDLRVGDIIEYLQSTREHFDLVAAVDVFVYIGNLKPVFNALRQRIEPGGYFVFSTEHSGERDYTLRQTGRFAHAPAYVQSLAREHDFAVEICQSSNLRKDPELWVLGDLFVLKRMK